MSRQEIKDAFEIEFREPPTYDLDTDREKWTGALLLGGEDTGVTATIIRSRFDYYGSVDVIKDEIMRYAIREFTRRWRVAANAEARLDALETKFEQLERRARFEATGYLQ